MNYDSSSHSQQYVLSGQEQRVCVCNEENSNTCAYPVIIIAHHGDLLITTGTTRLLWMFCLSVYDVKWAFRPFHGLHVKRPNMSIKRIQIGQLESKFTEDIMIINQITVLD